ncbi:hypothetical protein [Crossiella sp. NPDC003009]
MRLGDEQRPRQVAGEVETAIPARLDRLPWGALGAGARPLLRRARLAAGGYLAGGVAELVLGVAAAGKSPESVARPLSQAEAGRSA